MKIFIIDSQNNKRTLEVPYNITIRELKKRCDINNAYLFDIVFVFNGTILENDASLEFYGIKEESQIIFFGDFNRHDSKHKCPYGCGRLIPDKYKGCTELLRDYPEYFK